MDVEKKGVSMLVIVVLAHTKINIIMFIVVVVVVGCWLLVDTILFQISIMRK